MSKSEWAHTCVGIIAGVDLGSRINNRAHRTNEIDWQRLIVRRGQPFSLTVHCSSPLASDLELALLLKQDKITGDIVIRQRTAEGSDDKWWLRQQRAQDEVLLTVYSPARAAIGQYRLAFEDNVMDICFEILDRSKPALSNPSEDMSQRWDPAYISRVVVAMVNANDDAGVLVGKWQKPYTGGVVPTQWMSSVPILERWSRSKTGVKYGQCWVFSAVACTVLRCLGIPTRCITNFDSAHDTDGNVSIDRIFDVHKQQVDSHDSIWNFHCWIESYMQREDLSEGYGGWQVLDPTPQERSSGMFRCGPCPVKAIKEGELSVKYDAPFIFAEVNADVVNWEVRPDGQRKKLSSNSTQVGVNISTKSPYGDEREDVTLQYKYPEVTEVAPQTGDVQLKIKYASPVFGTDFDVIYELENTGGAEVRCKLNMVSKAVTYNSVHLGECQSSTVNVVVPAHKVHREVVRLLYEQYASCVSEHNVIRVIGVAQVSGRDQSILKMVNIPLSKPEITIKIPGWVILNQRITTTISFTNPLPVPLQQGVFTVEGAGLVSSKEIRIPGRIGPGQRVSVQLTFMPMRQGMRKFLVDFDSDRLQDVKGVATVVVHKTSPLFTSMLPNLRQRYGNVFSLFFGNRPAVILNGTKAIREAFISKANDFAGRPDELLLSNLTEGKGVIMANHGPSWRDHRRFALMTLRNFGLGKQSMEDRILGEVEHVAAELEKSNGKPMNPQILFHNASCDIICSIMYGTRYEYDHHFFQAMIQMMAECSKIANGPWGMVGLTLKVMNDHSYVKGHVKGIVAEHRASRIPKQPRDVIDSYLDQMDKREKSGLFDEEQMLATLLDLLFAGTDTTSNTICFAVFYLTTHPDIQVRCQREIDNVLEGKERASFEDKDRMPFMQAVIHESQRFCSTLPLSVYHATTKDTELQGYRIPKGTLVIQNLSSVLYEEGQWKFPHEFNPDNFLNDQGELQQPEAFMPFSVGPRMCLGEGLARMELFLVLVTLLRRFQFIWPEDVGPPDFTPLFGVTQAPKPFSMVFRPRDSHT
ncbi:hypothetical protein NHX12_003017 [Muraenolepis orangiensis]|uniref:Transglutaminase-like domain-containing protein n=1 Tax=Muraenolepis orangiensis TaxID=630683 RepID=A0A9Q0DZX7_9TELE|nr:hypothetical protein NHX12_003017 [Muraenolepis orangiensis]